jgi:hypothetical protein
MGMKKEFVIERQGKSFVLYAGLLDEAHSQGLKGITTNLLQIPSDENGHVAICQASVETEKGFFTGIGDASPRNVTQMMTNCLIRMAETRAKARALRDAVNVGVTALEELGDEIDLASEAAADQGEEDGEPFPPTLAYRQKRLDTQPATEKQLKAIYAIGHNARKLSEEGVDQKCKQLYGCSPRDLSKKDASEFIDLLKQDVA